MKIKLAILEKDRSYLTRIVSAFSARYAEKLEIYSFTDQEVAVATLEGAKIDVLLANDAYDVVVEALPRRCGFAYLVDSLDIESVKNQRAICKFQKADLIYKQILSIYSENAGNISGVKLGDESCRIVAFASPGGGVGSSSMAAACAAHFAAQGKRTLYLNLEKFGATDSFFQAEGQFDMSDVIFALKSKKANLSMKLESCVKQTHTGVYFYAPTKIALDMLELSTDDIKRLMSELQVTGSYDYIVMEMDISTDKNMLDLYRLAHGVIVVGDGSEISNTKITRAYMALATMEQNADAPIVNRMLLIYNKYSNKTSTAIGEIGLRSIGGAPRYEHATTEQVVAQLAAMDVFDKIF